MRAAAMSVWVFINILFFGMCGYLYLIWSQYWMYIEKQRLFSQTPGPQNTAAILTYQVSLPEKYHSSSLNNRSSIPNSKSRRSAVATLWGTSANKSSVYPSNNIVRKSHGSPRFPNIHTPVLEFDTEKYICDDLLSSDCIERTTAFKESLLKEFHRVLMGESKVFNSGLDVHNTYDVKYDSSKRKQTTKEEVMCALRRVKVKTVTAADEPFHKLGFNIPGAPLQEGRQFNNCAVVTSAGALLGSGLGDFIDSHDMVLRFNNAPTENYTEDVGSKTTFRVLNSQVVTKPQFKFLNDPLFRGVSILVWDPANFSSTLENWYQHPDYNLFPVYKRLLEEQKRPDVHLLNPQVLWGLWSLLQDTSIYRLRRNPPSSGFIGLWFSLHRCTRVRMFEYVPSARATRRCHYHVARDDTGCTLGAWHPLAHEKALAERMRCNPDIEVFQRGFVNIPGFNTVDCP